MSSHNPNWANEIPDEVLSDTGSTHSSAIPQESGNNSSSDITGCGLVVTIGAVLALILVILLGTGEIKLPEELRGTFGSDDEYATSTPSATPMSWEAFNALPITEIPVEEFLSWCEDRRTEARCTFESVYTIGNHISIRATENCVNMRIPYAGIYITRKYESSILQGPGSFTMCDGDLITVRFTDYEEYANAHPSPTPAPTATPAPTPTVPPPFESELTVEQILLYCLEGDRCGTSQLSYREQFRGWEVTRDCMNFNIPEGIEVYTELERNGRVEGLTRKGPMIMEVCRSEWIRTSR